MSWARILKTAYADPLFDYNTQCTGAPQDQALLLRDAVQQAFLNQRAEPCTAQWRDSWASCDAAGDLDRCTVSLDYLVDDPTLVNCKVADKLNAELRRCAASDHRPHGKCTVSLQGVRLATMEYTTFGADIHAAHEDAESASVPEEVVEEIVEETVEEIPEEREREREL